MPSYSETFKTPIGRFAYVHNMFTRVTKKNDAGQVMLDKNSQPVTEQQCTLIFDKTTSRAVFEAALKEVILAEWGEPGLERAKNGLIRLPFLAGDGKEARNKKTGEIGAGLGADKWFIRVATRKIAPVVFRSPTIPATYGTADDQIKSGDYGFAAIHAYTWTNAKNGDGISFGISYLQKMYAGENLGGSSEVNVAEYYETIPDEDTSALPGKTGDGAASLFG